MSTASSTCDPRQGPDLTIYVLGAVLGLAAGGIDVRFGDLLLTALLVLASTMFLGALRPQRPWRWTLVVAAFVPMAQCWPLGLKADS